MDDCKRPYPELQYAGDRVRACLIMPGLTAMEKNVLIALALYDGPSGAHPSIQRLADDLGITRYDVSRYLKRLARKGWVSKVRGQSTNHYTIYYNAPLLP